MTLDEILKVIKENTWICIRVNYEDASTQYFYPPKEQLPYEWMNYRVTSIEGHWNSGIVIDVEEVKEC